MQVAWARLEWLLSAAAAPLAVLWMRRFGFESGVYASAIVIGLLTIALFELHRPQQWKLLALGRRMRAGGPDELLEGEDRAPARVRALFAQALRERRLDPRWVRLIVAEHVEVARTRDAGPFHLVELHPTTAAGPASLLRALLTHELAHVAHRDPLVKRVLCGALVPLCTLVAAVSAGLIEGRTEGAGPLAIAVALLAAATLLPWAYATLQAVSFAMELRADREAAARCGARPVFELLDCLDDGGQPYRLSRPPQSRPPELVEGETNRLLEELLFLLPAHPPTWERRRRLIELQRAHRGPPRFGRDALPMFLLGSAPLLLALVLGTLAIGLAGGDPLRPAYHRKVEIARLLPSPLRPVVAPPQLGCSAEGDPLCSAALDAAVSGVVPPDRRQAHK